MPFYVLVSHTFALKIVCAVCVKNRIKQTREGPVPVQSSFLQAIFNLKNQISKKLRAWRFDPSRTFIKGSAVLPLIKVLLGSKRQARNFLDIYILVILVSKQCATFLHISLKYYWKFRNRVWYLSQGYWYFMIYNIMVWTSTWRPFRKHCNGNFWIANKLIHPIKKSE